MDYINRIFVFLFLCIGSRLLISFGIYKYPKRLSSIPLLLIGTSFIFLYLSGFRKTGAEAGGVIWWQNVRPIHGTLYLLSGILLFTKHAKHAYIPLLIDIAVGISVWLNHRIIQRVK